MVEEWEKNFTENIERDKGGSLAPRLHPPLLLEGKNDTEGRCPFLEGHLDIPKTRCFPLTYSAEGLAWRLTGKYVMHCTSRCPGFRETKKCIVTWFCHLITV